MRFLILKLILLLPSAALQAQVHDLVIDSNESNSLVYDGPKFIGFTPMKLSCGQEKKLLTVKSSLSNQVFTRSIPDCDFFKNHNPDRIMNVVFDPHLLEEKEKNYLISDNIFKENKSSGETVPTSRMIASTVISSADVEKELERKLNVHPMESLGDGYYLQFLALPYSEYNLKEVESVLQRYRISSSSPEYSYCVNDVFERKWIRFTVGPFKSRNDAKDYKDYFPVDSFIEYRKSCSLE
jgi:hypothetical protein